MNQSSSTLSLKSYQFILVFAVMIALYPVWRQFCYNMIFLGYNLFGEMRLATIFFAVILRIVLYPMRLFSLFTNPLEKQANLESDTIATVSDPVKRKQDYRAWLAKHRHLMLFVLFQFCFTIMNALVIGQIFLANFEPQKVASMLYPFIGEPSFPLQTRNFIPLIGQVDLTMINNTLNFYSAVGAGVVGFFEIIMHRKTDKKAFFFYLVVYPAGAYFITSQVPAGFEFSLLTFEVLTVALILVEKAVQLIAKKARNHSTTPSIA